MLWILILCAVLGNVGSFLLMLHDVKKHEELYPQWKNSKIPQKELIYTIIMFCVSIALIIFITLFYTQNAWYFTLKRVFVIVLLWPIGYIDFKTYRIPNTYVLFGLLLRLIGFIVELFCKKPDVWRGLLVDFIVALIVLVVAFLCTIFVKDGIGFGDMKLMAVLCLLLGVEGAWSAIFVSLLVSFFASLVLLLRKKKSRKDAIPFGPAIMVGTYLSIFLTGM